MLDLVTKVLWSLNEGNFGENEKIHAPPKETVDAIANMSLSKQLFEHTLFNKEFKKRPKRIVLKKLVSKSLAESPALLRWLEKQEKKTIPCILWVNYRIANQ